MGVVEKQAKVGKLVKSATTRPYRASYEVTFLEATPALKYIKFRNYYTAFITVQQLHDHAGGGTETAGALVVLRLFTQEKPTKRFMRCARAVV